MCDLSPLGTFASDLPRVAAGAVLLDHELVTRLVERRPNRDPLGRLTERERDVLALIARGLTNAELSDPIRQVGAVLEASGCHPGRTALDHLRILRTAARLPLEAAERVLDETGLAGDAQRRVGEFSLGVRQRLGLAAALLGDPSVLVLDEPTNGLDPPGVRWLREYLRRLADEGRTVLLSSHALSEVELTADHVLVLAGGRLLRSSTLTEFRAEAGVGSRVRTPHAGRLGAVPDAAGHAYRLTDDGLAADATPEEVGELAAAHGVALHGLVGTSDLEHAFFRLIHDAGHAERQNTNPGAVA